MTEVELDELGLGATILRRAGTIDRAVDRANILARLTWSSESCFEW